MWLYIEPEELLPSEDQKCGRPTVGQMTKRVGVPRAIGSLTEIAATPEFSYPKSFDDMRSSGDWPFEVNEVFHTSAVALGGTTS